MRIFAFYSKQLCLHFCIVKENIITHHLMSKYFYILLVLLSTLRVTGQGWERIYSGGGQDEAYSVAVTPDGGYVLSGVYNNNTLQLIKVDVDGFLQWSKINLVSGSATGRAIAVTADSSFLIAGTRGTGASKDGMLLKTSSNGQVLWNKNLGVAGEDDIAAMAQLPDGSVVMTGTVVNTDEMRVLKTDANGNLVWSKVFNLPDYKQYGYGITIASNGDIVAVGERRKFPAVKDIYVVRLDAAGNLLWESTYSIGESIQEAGQSIVAAPDGNFVIAGNALVPASSQQGLLMKIPADGTPIPMWFRTFSTAAQAINAVDLDGTGGYIVAGRTPETVSVRNEIYIARVDDEGALIWENAAGKAGLSEGFSVRKATNGGFVAVGFASTSSSPFQAQRYAYMVRTDAEGRIFTNYLSGKVYIDQNDDCTLQPAEQGLKDWLLKISSPDFTRYMTTGADGSYFIMVDTGTYDIQLYTPNNYWAPCAGQLSAAIESFYDTTDLNIGVRRTQVCPYNEIDIQTPVLRRCADNEYTVRYCNKGTSSSANTRILVEKSPSFTIMDASIPYTTNGDSLWFDIGTLAAGDCGSFSVSAFLDCDVDLVSAHCMKAYITPDTFCSNTANWDGALIQAKAKCVDGRVKLSVTNHGTGPNENELEYVIIDDLVVLFTIPPIQYSGLIAHLPAGEDTLVYDAPANGHTYRIIAQQTDGYPGMSVPTAAVEGCVTDTTTAAVSTGFYTMFPEDDAEPFAAADCQETNETDFNPTFLKRGHPKGYKEPHLIQPDTDIDYLIRFVNTGSDTVSQVIVRDTLSPWLDPATVRPGTSSHPYTYTVYGEGIVQFRFSNVHILPHSAGEGYVKFRVSQKTANPCDAVIRNAASIYFDENAPVVTNSTLHTVCDSFLEPATVKTTDIQWPGASVRFYPNPFTENAFIDIKGVTAGEYRFELYDTYGRLVFNRSYSNSDIRLSRNQLPSGFLFYRLLADGRPVATGKILAQ